MKVLESELLNNIGSESTSLPEVMISPVIVVVLLSLPITGSPYAAFPVVLILPVRVVVLLSL